jgi:hypothetical protein
MPDKVVPSVDVNKLMMEINKTIQHNVDAIDRYNDGEGLTDYANKNNNGYEYT